MNRHISQVLYFKVAHELSNSAEWGLQELEEGEVVPWMNYCGRVGVISTSRKPRSAHQAESLQCGCVLTAEMHELVRELWGYFRLYFWVPWGVAFEGRLVLSPSEEAVITQGKARR